jgi:hypothetical protein
LSAVEFIAAGAAAVGIAAGSFSIYAYSRSNSRQKNSEPLPVLENSVPATTDNKESGDQGPVEPGELSPKMIVREQTRTIPKSELERSKRELRTLLLEKELVSAALTRLYEAEAAKEISKSEREILGAKYVAELKALDDKITKMDAFIQIGDLETLRNQLIQLVEEKIESIEKRIDNTRKLAEPLIAEMTRKSQQQSVSVPPVVVPSVDETQRGTPIPDISDMLQNEKPEPRIDPIAEQPTVVLATAPTMTRAEIPKMASSPVVVDKKRPADKVEELQREILEALDRLERLDVDNP